MMLDRTEMVYMCVCGMLQVILSEVQCFCRVTVYTTLICTQMLMSLQLNPPSKEKQKLKKSRSVTIND